MIKLFALGVAVLALFVQSTRAQYPGYQHSGSLYILTTPDGADLSAGASEEGFPLLVRLDKEWFDFGQAKAAGEDVRFASSTAMPLAYEIDHWDAAGGTACIWVRIPNVKGNARQEIRMFWGKPDAESESKGSAVFNASNGYLSVCHMNCVVKDEVGTLELKNQGATVTSGMIGNAQHFDAGKGIAGGTNITTYPVGNGPHSSELWIKTDMHSGALLKWGVTKPNSVVQMNLGRPPHVNIDCFYSLAGIHGDSILPTSQWVHVMHTYEKGDSRIYVNGRLDASRTGSNVSLTIGSPAEMRIGGGTFIGDMDEVRISNVARSADWVKLQYENQKPLQTAVGALAPPGTEFQVSAKSVELMEGKSTTITAKAGGAQKVYWILKARGKESVVAVDKLSFKLDAGRVTGEQSLILQFKAVNADGVKTLDIPVTIHEDIPEPVFTLKAPTKWDGRQTIEVVPQISNLSQMQAKGVGDLKYVWSVSGLAVIKEIVPGKLTLIRAQNSGKLAVTAAVSNGGEAISQTIEIVVNEPAKDAWVERTPDKDEKPVDYQFYARNDRNEGTLYYNGTLNDPADSVFLRLYADDKLIKTESQKPGRGENYAFSVKLAPGLINYKIEFGLKGGNIETVLHTVSNLICGDAYIINGQSNAVSYNYRNEKTRPDLSQYTSPWIRSFGGNGEVGGNPTTGGWGNAVIERLTPTSPDRIHFIGVWGMAMAKKLVEDEHIPICILNGSVGGTRIDQHMPNPANHRETANHAYSIYGNLLMRVAAAKLTHGIRGILWHQGEADQGFDGPDNCYGSEMYERYFVDLSAAWKQDFPNIQHYYVFQIWPNACRQGGTQYSDKLRDIQRRFSRLYSNMSVMPTLGFPSGQGCHFDLADYEKMGLSMAPLLERDANGKVFNKPVTAPNLQRVYYTSERKDEIVLEFDQPMAWSNALATLFHLKGIEEKIDGGIASGNVIKIKLASASTADTITYLVDKNWDGKNLLYGKNGIAALTFSDVLLSPSKTNP